MGFSSKVAFLTFLIALSPLVALHRADGQGLPGNRDRPFDRPPVTTPNLGKPTFKPDGKFKDLRATPKLGDEKLIKKILDSRAVIFRQPRAPRFRKKICQRRTRR